MRPRPSSLPRQHTAWELHMADLFYFAGGAALFALMMVYALWLNRV